jgi:homoserine kinase
VFKHIIAGNNLKPFRIRTAYVNANTGVGISGQGTTILLGGDETNDDEIDQAKNKAAALEIKRGIEMKRENEIFLDESYIPEDRMFAVIV